MIYQNSWSWMENPLSLSKFQYPHSCIVVSNSFTATMRLLPLTSLILSSQFVFSIPDLTDSTWDTIDLFTLDDRYTDDMPMWEDWDSSVPSFSFPPVGPDQFLTSYSTDFSAMAADSSGSCRLSKKKKRDAGESCAAPITVEIPSLPDVFGIGIGDGSDETGLNSDSSGANTWDWNDVVDPCVLRTPYITHVCCRGRLGSPYGLGYSYLDQCVLGMSSSLGFCLFFG